MNLLFTLYYIERICKHAGEKNPAFRGEWILRILKTWTQWPITGVQEINSYVCDWLHWSALWKHVANRNFWCFPECKHKCVQEPLQNLFRQYPIITVLTEGAFDCVRKWMCGVRAQEKCQLRESHTEYVRFGSTGLGEVLLGYGLVCFGAFKCQYRLAKFAK